MLSSGPVAHPEGTLHVCYSTFATLATAAPSAFQILCWLKINRRDLPIHTWSLGQFAALWQEQCLLQYCWSILAVKLGAWRGGGGCVQHGAGFAQSLLCTISLGRTGKLGQESTPSGCMCRVGTALHGRRGGLHPHPCLASWLWGKVSSRGAARFAPFAQDSCTIGFTVESHGGPVLSCGWALHPSRSAFHPR